MPVQSYRDLVGWQKARELATAIYKQTSVFPTCEQYGLTSQLRRAAVSAVSNIAAGQGRQSTGEFLQFLAISRGSLFELETQLVVAGDLGFIKPAAVDALLLRTTELAKVLQGLISSLQTKRQTAGH